MPETPGELKALLRRYDPDLQALIIAARNAVLKEVGACHEHILQIKKLLVFQYSTTEKPMRDGICFLVVYTEHVNLMFPQGVMMDDPQNLLQGAGKAMRHIKLHAPIDLEERGLRALVRQGKKRPGLGKPETPLRKVVTTIKAKPPEEEPGDWPRLF